MSTKNIIDKRNLSVNRAIAEYMSKESMEVYKRSRFDVACEDKKNHRLMLSLYRLSCKGYCNIDSEQRASLREEVILRAIRKIEEL